MPAGCVISPGAEALEVGPGQVFFRSLHSNCHVPDLVPVQSLQGYIRLTDLWHEPAIANLSLLKCEHCPCFKHGSEPLREGL